MDALLVGKAYPGETLSHCQHADGPLQLVSCCGVAIVTKETYLHLLRQGGEIVGKCIGNLFVASPRNIPLVAAPTIGRAAWLFGT